jgi:hypothetical protein
VEPIYFSETSVDIPRTTRRYTAVITSNSTYLLLIFINNKNEVMGRALWHIRSKQELWSQNSRALLARKQQRGMVFSAQSVPMAAYAMNTS